MIGRRWVFAAIIASAASARAGKVCDLAFTDCPAKFANAIVKVPPELIWLDANLHYCNEYVRIVNGSAKPPSIVFIIDNSASMDENDPKIARFDVVSALLDNINGLAPTAEVGLVVFTRRLAFDHRDNPFFKTAFPADTSQHDSFVPLTPLNKVFPNNRTGLDTLKALLGHNANGDLTYATQLPASRNNSGIGRRNNRDGTDITLGFLAAKLAMQDSKSDKSGQFFVFLSDGGASSPDNGREDMLWDYTKGIGVPTTFTIFFDTQNPTPVANPSIVEMTNKIKLNGYSASNPKSAYWAINLPETELMDLLSNNVVGNVLSVPAKPEWATVTLGDSTFRSARVDDRVFGFPRHFNLKTDTTRFVMEYAFSYVDSSAGHPVPKERKVPYAFTFVRTAAAALPQGLGQSCREQAAIGLYRDGQPVSEVTVDDTQLEARLAMPDGLPCPGCRLEAMPAGRAKDHESITLAPASGYLTGMLRQGESASPASDDGRLEHSPYDSIVVRFVNPENPLDAVRRAYPYRPAPTIVQLAHDSGFVRPPYAPNDPLRPQFTLIAPAGFQAAPREPADRWALAPAPSPEEAGRYAGLVVEASRPFSVDIHVFSNLGQFVNKVEFTVGQADFDKLEKGPGGHSRRLRVLWDSRAQRGGTVATGVYIVKTTVNLLPIPGLAEDKAMKVDYSRVGVLRSP